MCQGLYALLQGDAMRACVIASAAATEAEAKGTVWVAMLARGLRCYGLMQAGRWDELDAALRDLERLSQRTDAATLVACTRFTQLASTPHPQLPVLMGLVAGHDRAPMPARWARQLARAEVGVRRIDATLVGALRGRFAAVTLGRREPPDKPWAHGWGADFAARLVVLGDGRLVDLARSPVPLRLLARLVEGGGVADKEALVLACWDQPDYHPLRDDKRLQVTVNRLRKTIEDDPTRPERLVTVENGYALGSCEPFTWVMSAATARNG
jgi:hypothetical protein